MTSLCNLQFQKLIQTLHNDGSHIEDVHLLFCAHFMNIFRFFRGVELRHFLRPKMLRLCLVCVICNSNFIFKLCIKIVYLFVFVCFDSLRSINNLSVIKGRVFLG